MKNIIKYTIIALLVFSYINNIKANDSEMAKKTQEAFNLAQEKIQWLKGYWKIIDIACDDNDENCNNRIKTSFLNNIIQINEEDVFLYENNSFSSMTYESQIQYFTYDPDYIYLNKNLQCDKNSGVAVSGFAYQIYNLDNRAINYMKELQPNGYPPLNIYYKYTMDENKNIHYIEKISIYIMSYKKGCAYSRATQFTGEDFIFIILGKNKIMMNNKYILEKMSEEEFDKLNK